MDNERTAVINIGDAEYTLLLTTKATKEIAGRYGGLENLGEKLIPHYQVCAGCEKAHRGVKICDRYPDGIPEQYRRKWEGLPDETGTPDCPDFEKEKDPDRWVNPEWRAIIEQLRKG